MSEEKLKNISDVYLHELMQMSDQDVLSGLKPDAVKENGLAILDQAKQKIWVSCDFMLPEMNVPVLAIENGKIFPLARIEYDEETGWLWARGFNDLSDIRGYEADDDYQPSFWMPMPTITGL